MQDNDATGRLSSRPPAGDDPIGRFERLYVEAERGEAEVPWEEMAFRTITRTLRRYFLDRRLGPGYPVHLSAIERRPPLTPDLLAAG